MGYADRLEDEDPKIHEFFETAFAKLARLATWAPWFRGATEGSRIRLKLIGVHPKPANHQPPFGTSMQKMPR